MMISKENARMRADMYRFLSRCYKEEIDGKTLAAMKNMSFPAAEGKLGEGYAMLRGYLDSCGENATEELAVDYARVFLAAGSADGAAAIPCESVYASPAKIYMQESWEEVCAEYARFGMAKAEGYDDLMEDHLALELEFMAHLIEKGEYAAQKSFAEKHLSNWVGSFAADIDKYARRDFYKAIGRITEGFIGLDAQLLAAVENGDVGVSRSFSVRNERMSNILARLGESYHVYAPMRFAKRGPKGKDLIRYGEIRELTDIVYREKSNFSPKECIYPVSQTLFRFDAQDCSVQEKADDKGIIIICRACDINAFRRLDNIFLHNGEADLFYGRMREKVKFILLECRESFENCFCASMGTNKALGYSAAMRIDDICALMEICDEELLPYFLDEVPIEFAPEFVKENPRKARIPAIEREKLGEICKMEFWDKYDGECIACGGCSTVCPGCSCFDTVDVIYDETSMEGERRRVWSSCMLRDFTQTAGGGLARKTQGANMRFKTLHKIYDYCRRFGGEHMCVGCGRCIDRCPRGIDFLDTINSFAEALEKQEGSDK